MLHFNERQRPHWACWQYGQTRETRGWLGVERWQLCLWDTSRSTKCHRWAAVGHWISLCVKCCRMVDSIPIPSLSCSQYNQTYCLSGWDDNACLGVRNTCSIGAWPKSLLYFVLYLYFGELVVYLHHIIYIRHHLIMLHNSRWDDEV